MIRRNKQLFSIYCNVQTHIASKFGTYPGKSKISACMNGVQLLPVAADASHVKRKSPGFNIVPVTTADRKQVLELLRNSFFIDEPMIKSLKLSCKVPKELEDHCLEALDEGLSLMAIDKNAKPLAVALNATSIPGDAQRLAQYSENCKCKKTKALFNFWSELEKQSNLWRIFSVSHVWEVRILSTSFSVRGVGMSRVLLERSVQMAREQCYPLVRIDCTSRYSAKAAESLGFYCLHTIHYKDFLGPNKKPVIKPSGPHTSLKLYVLPLDN